MTEKCPECGSDNFRSGTDPETGKVGHDCRICGHSWTQREAGLP